MSLTNRIRVAAIAMLILPTAAYSAILDIPPNVNACCIGENSPASAISSYWAQSFIAPEERIGALSLMTLNNVPPNNPEAIFKFRWLVTEATEVSGEFNPTNILLESPIIEVRSQQPKVVSLNLSSVNFTVGNRYAFIIDSFSARDGLIDVGQFLLNNQNAYSEGRFYTLYASELGRDFDFAAQWNGNSVNTDFAFSLSAQPVPLPSAFWPLLTGLFITLSKRSGREIKGLTGSKLSQNGD